MLGDPKSQASDASPFRIEEVGLDSPLLEAVIKLHAASKGYLGHFPKGAFEDHARRKMILVAIAPNNIVAGYVLYRVARNRAAIVHLTTSQDFRGKGVARTLVDDLKSRTRHLLGISLRCRRDYQIDDMWQSFGFSVRHSKEGRGADGALLDYWWFDNGHHDLFSLAASREDVSEGLLTAIDANVFYDLTCDGRPHSEDTRVLQADWLQDSVVLCVTHEIYNEIHRSLNEEDKKRCRTEAQAFRELKTDDEKIQALGVELAPFFNGATFERDISDMRHVAHAIAAECPFFVTRDRPMLERSDPIFEKYGLRILHPTDLVNRFDILRRGAEYRPARLEGSRWRERLVVADDVEAIVSLFKHRSKERSGNFEQRVRHYLGNPHAWTSRVVTDDRSSPTVYLVHSSNTPQRLEIALLRHIDHPLSGTLLRHIVHEISRETNNSKVITVSDPEPTDEAVAALTELGFVPDGNAWWKMSVTGLITREELISKIRLTEIPPSLKERLVGAFFVTANADDELTTARLENLFSPVKLTSSAASCYIVSIRQSWAAHFFDIPVGGQTLIDLNERLHLGIEGAYYCSANNTHVVAPGRVLWYVSGKGSMSIKACSQLEERIVGTPKEVYARFRHLGVYAWKHVLETAGGNLDHPLMAFRFARTERFTRPVTLTDLQRMEIPQPQNPRKISGEQFAVIYRLGMNL
jgi:ribosomal protein S18 acetylase RimI-like enzyme/predicted nucleic acid-binding protein